MEPVTERSANAEIAPEARSAPHDPPESGAVAACVDGVPEPVSVAPVQALAGSAEAPTPASIAPPRSPWYVRHVSAFLTRPLPRYDRHAHNDLAALRATLRKGDVLLSQGNQRISAVIQYLTQSPWSHASLYVGDEVLRRGGALAEQAQRAFGSEARWLLVDALPEGVVLTPVSQYTDFNLRLCRASLAAPHRAHIVDGAIRAVGLEYDLANLLDLARHYLPARLVPRRFRPARRRLGSGSRHAVICSSLIGGLFQEVGYPVLPTHVNGELRPPGWRDWLLRRRTAGAVFRRRHPTFLAPRDFDLSPYFEIVKFNARGFDYRRIAWEADEPPTEPATTPPTTLPETARSTSRS